MIYYPKVYGTCAGANKAIEAAYKLKKENKDKNTYVYKDMAEDDNKYPLKTAAEFLF